MPKGREREFEQLVGGGVYEAGFHALAEYLRNGESGLSSRPSSSTAVEPQGVVATAFGGPEVLQFRRLNSPRGEVLIRQIAVGVNYIDVYIRKGLYRMIEPPAPIGMEAAGVVVESRSTRFGRAIGWRMRARRPAPTSRCERCPPISSSCFPTTSAMRPLPQ